MAGKTLQVRIPAWTANLLPNLLGLASIATICTFIGLLVGYKWGGLSAGLFGLVLTVWMQWSAVPATSATVTPIKKAS